MKKDLLQVLVTGASGFVGRALVSELVANGSQIKVLVRKPSALPVEVEQVMVDLGEIEQEVAKNRRLLCNRGRP
jgi:nucleoside-diphosphate-sugar epimerase